jgi:hypothetical protein
MDMRVPVHVMTADPIYASHEKRFSKSATRFPMNMRMIMLMLMYGHT